MLPSNPEAHKFDCEDNLGICQKWYEQFRDNIKRSGTTDDLNVLWRRFHWSRIKVLMGIRHLRNCCASCYHLGQDTAPVRSGVRQRPSIFRSGICADRQKLGILIHHKQPHLPSIKWSGREGRLHCRTAPKEDQVGSIPECIRIQKCPIICISYTSPTLDEQKSALYTLTPLLKQQLFVNPKVKQVV